MIIGTNYGFIRGQRLATLSELNRKANSTHTHSTDQITSGTLPLTRGGTGVTSLSALKSALGITDSAGLKVSQVQAKGPISINANSYKSYSLGITAKVVLIYGSSTSFVTETKIDTNPTFTLAPSGTSIRIHNYNDHGISLQGSYQFLALG